MSEPTPETPTQETTVAVKEQGVAVPSNPKRSTNWGIYMLIISILVVIGVVIYVTRKDAKMNMNRNMVYNSVTMSNNSGYAYKANNGY